MSSHLIDFFFINCFLQEGYFSAKLLNGIDFQFFLLDNRKINKAVIISIFGFTWSRLYSLTCNYNRKRRRKKGKEGEKEKEEKYEYLAFKSVDTGL